MYDPSSFFSVPPIPSPIWHFRFIPPKEEDKKNGNVHQYHHKDKMTNPGVPRTMMRRVGDLTYIQDRISERIRKPVKCKQHSSVCVFGIVVQHIWMGWECKKVE